MWLHSLTGRLSETERRREEEQRGFERELVRLGEKEVRAHVLSEQLRLRVLYRCSTHLHEVSIASRLAAVVSHV